ncbi:MAG: AraC family transcriptional regulator [Negativicutes bacterium]
MQSVHSLFAEKMCFADIEHSHIHSFGHLIVPMRGTLNMIVDYHSIMIDPQHVLLLPPDCEHSYYSPVQNEFLVFYIPQTVFLSQGMSEIQYRDFDSRWRALRFLMLSECENETFHQPIHTAAMRQLFDYSFQLLREKQELPSIRYLHENFQTHVSLETLARLEHYHMGYYGQWFQKKMGVSVQLYVQNLRIQEAKRLLRETDHQIQVIAQLVGYEHQASLNRVFRQVEGMTPRAFRQKIWN